MNAWCIEELGDSALLLRLGDAVDATTSRRVHACIAALRAAAPAWLLDITPAHTCLALHVDPQRIDARDPLGAARAWLHGWLGEHAFEAMACDSRCVEIPALYGGEAGPDLDAVAAHARISAEAVIARHTAAEYTVSMLGFAPGFPYLLGLDPALAMPRLDTPRKCVAMGSVGIGGSQTGIYPDAGPGGWRLIARTPLRLFDAMREPPSLLLAGDRVRFVAIDAPTFLAIAAETP